MSLNLDKSTWKRVAFGDVVKNLNVTVKDPTAEGIDRVIAMEHLDPGELKIGQWGDLESGTTFTRKVRPGQTLFGKRRAYQRKAAYAEFDAICSGDILVFEADARRLLPDFLPFLVQSEGFYENALGTSAGSLSPRTNWSDISRYEFLLPPLDRQKMISQSLWTVERHRDRLSTLKSEAESFRSALLEEFLSSLSGGVIALGDVLEIVRGGSPRPINDYFTDEPDGWNWIKIGDVPADGKYIDSTAQKIKSSGLNKTRQVRPGDLLLSNSMSFGRPYIVRIEGCIHDGWLALSDNQNRWRTEFLFYVLRSAAVQSQFLQGAAGSTVKNLNTDIVKRVEVPLPCLQDQDSFLKRMEASELFVANLEIELKQLRTLRSALLQEIFGDPA